MKINRNNYAFIDSQNLNLGIRSQGWKLDFKKLHKFLKDKFRTSKQFIFIGYVEENKKLYSILTKIGYQLIFKPTINSSGNIKGNVDAELVLHAMIEFDNYDKALIISGDGDFYCLIDYLNKKNKLEKIVIPNKRGYSSLLRNFIGCNKTYFLSGEKKLLEYKEEGIISRDALLR
jgi:uncharacterized LabA/DUF88 family protein